MPGMISNSRRSPFDRQMDTPELVRFLLNQKAHILVHDKNGNTPLHLSTARGQVEVAQLLIENGADVNAQNDEGSTPLHRASEGQKEAQTLCDSC